MVLATGVTATTWMLPVFANTSMTGRHVSTLLTVLLEACGGVRRAAGVMRAGAIQLQYAQIVAAHACMGARQPRAAGMQLCELAQTHAAMQMQPRATPAPAGIKCSDVRVVIVSF